MSTSYSFSLICLFIAYLCYVDVIWNSKARQKKMIGQYIFIMGFPIAGKTIFIETGHRCHHKNNVSLVAGLQNDTKPWHRQELMAIMWVVIVNISALSIIFSSYFLGRFCKRGDQMPIYYWFIFPMYESETSLLCFVIITDSEITNDMNSKSINIFIRINVWTYASIR